MKIEQAPSAATSVAGDREWIEIPDAGDTALILHTQRLSTEDGPGIRTTVFFKGCPLRCSWCHNPESISAKQQIQWLETRCIGCGTCIKTCDRGSLSKTEAGLVRDRSLCLVCGKCAEQCPANAMEVLGKRVGLEELTAELLRDRVYYAKSGGGITLSGGEPLMQPDFCANLLRAMKEKGISTAVDTCGLCSIATLEQVLPYTDLILYDLKEIDPARHKEFTGRDNGRILENIIFIRDDLAERDDGKILWIRTPLIPGTTASRETVERIGEYISTNLGGCVKRWELCAFNNLCRDKYRRLGVEWQHASTPLMSRQELKELEQIAKNTGVNPDIIFITGASRLET
jgi:pyruvate formate lyase activating enzyme